MRQGRAEVVSKHVIRMIAKDYRHRTVIVSAEEAERRMQYDIASETGRINQKQAMGIPFAGNIRRLGLAAAPTPQNDWAVA